MFQLFYKRKQEFVKIYAVRNDKHGYPSFLVYDDKQWKYISAKHFTNEIDEGGGGGVVMWNELLKVLNPYEATKAHIKNNQLKPEKMNMLKWKLMSKHQKLMYSLPIYQRNKQRVNLECGIILDFTNNTIRYESDYIM